MIVLRRLAAPFALALLAACGAPAPSALHPPAEPDDSGYLRVSELHELYWEVAGDPAGIPVIVLHGGPGGSAAPGLRRYFDPARFRVLLFDQRGAYRSRPRGEWRENTTGDLIQDIDRLRDHVGLQGPAILFGGGWGSTLALAYAEARPERVGGMVLRSVFLGTREEIDYLYHGGAGMFFPGNWERLRKVIPEPDVPDYPRQLFEMITGGDAKEREAAIEGWSYYRQRMASISRTDAETDEILLELDDRLAPQATLENFYMMNGSFLAEGQLLDQVDRIAHIPTFIVQGRYDVIHPPYTAWRLSRRLDTVHLELSDEAGHAHDDPSNQLALLRGLDWVARRFRGAAAAE